MGTTAQSGLDRSLATGVAVFRWAAWVWMAALALLARDQLDRQWVSVVLVGAAFVVTAGLTVLQRSRPEVAQTWPAVVIELVVGAALLIGDGLAYGPDPATGAPPALGSIWPVTGVLAAGVVFGPWAGGISGFLFGAANIVGKAIAGEPSLADQSLSISSTAVQFTLAGVALGLATQRLRQAEQELADARARDAVARTLHDGVLQTLAVIQHRSTEVDLAELARTQERELRDYLFGTGSPQMVGAGGDLGEALRAAAARIDARHGLAATVFVADDIGALDEATVEALAGAASEALTNAAKHGDAATATVYAEPSLDDSEIICTVNDTGRGFDLSATPEGEGISGSIRGRMADVGGHAEVRSHPGRGTEVILTVPASRARSGTR